MRISEARTIGSKVPIPERSASTIRKVFDGGAHFDVASSTDWKDPSIDTATNASVAADAEQVFQQALMKAGTAELRRVRVEIDRQEIQLFGRVSSFYLKQLAQEVLRPHAGEKQITNHLQVHGQAVTKSINHPR